MRKILSVALASAVLFVLPVGAHAVTLRDARGFVDTIGVNVHLFYTDTAYGDFSMVKQRLQELGVRHIRDGFDPARRQWFYDRINSLGAAGIKSTLISCGVNLPAYQLDGWISDAKNKIRSSLHALEGANEPNLSGYSDWATRTRDCQWWLHRLARDSSYGAPLDQMILGPSPTGTTFEALGDLSAIADGGNYHPYPGGQNPSGPVYYPFSRAMAEIRQANFGGREVPVVATETGYHDAVNCSCGHPPISQSGEAIYLPRLFFEYARAGMGRAFTYELVDEWPDPERDEPEKNFGLFENDWSYKPVASALRNLIGFVDSPSASSRTSLDYSLSSTEDEDGSGPAGAVKDLLLQEADGTYWLALWQDSTVWNTSTRKDIANASNHVRVTLPRAMNVTAHLPTRGTGSYGSLTGASAFTAGVPDDVLLVKLTD